MKTVYINNLGFLEGPSIEDATIALEISDEEFAKTSNWPIDKLWQWDYSENKFKLVTTPILDDLRAARALKCFPIINRGNGWYKTLSEEQQSELDTWYQAWLDVTETGEIPQKPEWLN